MTTEKETISSVRIDKWLWAARFYKQRSMATDAVQGGHIQLNGQRPKPAKPVKPGDMILVKKGGVEWLVEVLAVAERRGSASDAALLYREQEASIEKRQQQSEQRRIERMSAPIAEKRPNKQQRRQIIRFKSEG